jgi:hypothetical protein
MNRCSWLLAAPLLLVTALTLPARAQSFDELSKAYDAAEKAWYAKENRSLAEHPGPAYITKMRALAEQAPGKPEAVAPLMWLLGHTNVLNWVQQDPSGLRNWALDALRKDHLASPALKDGLAELHYLAWDMGADKLIPVYDEILQKNKDPDVLAQANAGLGYLLASSFADAPPKDVKRAEQLFRTVLKDYPKSDAAKMAGPFIFEIERLQVGMKAPDIEGIDIDGKPIKLSQFLGQVVVLDFWGFW